MMRSLVLGIALLGAVLTLGGCFSVEFVIDDGSTSGRATYITVGYSFEAMEASASGTWNSYINATIGTTFPDIGIWPELVYDEATRTYSTSYTDPSTELNVTVQLNAAGDTVLYAYAHRVRNGYIDTIEATNIPLRANPDADEGMSYYGDNEVVYRVLQGDACSKVQRLVGENTLPLPEPTWITSISCGPTSYLEVVLRY